MIYLKSISHGRSWWETFWMKTRRSYQNRDMFTGKALSWLQCHHDDIRIASGTGIVWLWTLVLPRILRSFTGIIQEVARVLNTFTEILAASAEIRRDEVYPIYLRHWTRTSLLTVAPTLEREVMFAYRHIGNGICLLVKLLSIHHLTTSQALNNIQTVSG